MLEQLPITEKYKNWIDEVIWVFLDKTIDARHLQCKQFPY